MQISYALLIGTFILAIIEMASAMEVVPAGAQFQAMAMNKGIEGNSGRILKTTNIHLNPFRKGQSNGSNTFKHGLSASATFGDGMAPKHLLKNDKKTDGFNQSRPPFSAVFPPAADVGDHATLNDIIANPIEFVSTTLIPSIRQALIGNNQKPSADEHELVKSPPSHSEEIKSEMLQKIDKSLESHNESSSEMSLDKWINGGMSAKEHLFFDTLRCAHELRNNLVKILKQFFQNVHEFGHDVSDIVNEVDTKHRGKRSKSYEMGLAEGIENGKKFNKLNEWFNEVVKQAAGKTTAAENAKLAEQIIQAFAEATQNGEYKVETEGTKENRFELAMQSLWDRISHDEKVLDAYKVTPSSAGDLEDFNIQIPLNSDDEHEWNNGKYHHVWASNHLQNGHSSNGIRATNDEGWKDLALVVTNSDAIFLLAKV